ncbi:MAG: hypothetical protein CME36_03795 [unclassified Hahellaceae]|nr:hypothetical protein [Hahellaceae bacterium]|tara:strand:+ start:7538 stop:8098 length:561 start_codon:yes stop_codon:yes gene_type:complete
MQKRADWRDLVKELGWKKRNWAKDEVDCRKYLDNRMANAFIRASGAGPYTLTTVAVIELEYIADLIRILGRKCGKFAGFVSEHLPWIETEQIDLAVVTLTLDRAEHFARNFDVEAHEKALLDTAYSPPNGHNSPMRTLVATKYRRVDILRDYLEDLRSERYEFSFKEQIISVAELERLIAHVESDA